MPTYTNTTSNSLTVSGVYFKGNETKTSLLILDHPDLTRDSDAPYYSPFGTTYTVTGTDTTVIQAVTVSSEYLRLIPKSGTITVYINTIAGDSIEVDNTMVIQNNGRIEQLHVQFTGAGELFIQEVDEYEFITYESNSTGSFTGFLGDVNINNTPLPIDGTVVISNDVQITGSTYVCESTPTIDTAAYASGDLIGDKIELTNAARTAAGSGIIQSISIIDDDGEEAAMDVLFFDTDPTNTTFTDNDPVDIDEADLENYIGHASVASADYSSFASNSAASVQNVGIPFDLASGTSIWAVIVSRGTPTYTATDDLTLRVGILRD